MNILWVTNIPLPEASQLMEQEPIHFGGWLVNTSTNLAKLDNINISVAFPKDGISEIEKLKGKEINYYAFSPVSDKIIFNRCINRQFEDIIKIAKPDIVHIFGTEFPHTLSMINVCNKFNIKSVISIQGLVSIISQHYMASIPNRVQKRFTFRDIIKRDNIIQQQKKFRHKGRFEIEAIEKAHNIIGRTTWDKACTMQINPNVEYHFCNETLRSEFYKHEWSLDRCERYSIFISQASYPVKGLHFMLEAMPLILKKFPDAKIYISGPDITKSDLLKDKLKRTSYAKYIIEIIEKYNLKNNIIFTGVLDEKQMCERYLKSNVFVCPSSIENSPNSLGEAMILGVPCVASDVGGISDLLKHKKDGFIYQMDAPYMLAHYVCDIFENEQLAVKLSLNSKQHAHNTHNCEINLNRLIEIYKKINMSNR